MNYLEECYNDIRVGYLPHLDGGGRGFGQDYLPVVKRLFGKVDRLFEFCAGPGFIGFSLLANGLCDSLCLADINPEAVEAARWTVRRNRLEDRVSVYLSDGLDQIPNSERWDLVVSNPPHFKDSYHDSIRHYDGDWDLHLNFYKSVARFLNPGGSALIQENYEGSTEQDFLAMINQGGLMLAGSFMHKEPNARNYFDTYYFIWSRLHDIKATSLEPTARTALQLSGDSAETVEVSLSREGEPQRVEVKSLTPYRFLFSNNLGRPVALLVYAKRFRLIERFLRTFGTIGEGKSLSFIFQFYPGEYCLKDSENEAPLCRVRVA
jgi:SAM-dependent methyltransferase